LTNVTRTANSTTAPDGTNTAVKIASTTGTWQTFLSQVSVAGITAVPTTFSCYAKAAEASWFCLAGIQYGEAIAFFNLATGALGTRSAGSAHSITPVGNGWYRCSVTCASAASTQWGFFPGSADNTLTPAAIGNGVHVWGPQLEAGAFPTSYIPTTTATVTRAADVASMTGTNFSSWYRQDEGTLYAKALNKITNYIASINDSSPLNQSLTIYQPNSSQTALFSRTSSGVQAQIIVTGATNAFNKFAGCYKTNDFAVSVNSGTVGTDTSGAIPISTTFDIGAQRLGVAYGMSGIIARLTYYPVRLPDAQLQALTAT